MSKSTSKPATSSEPKPAAPAQAEPRIFTVGQVARRHRVTDQHVLNLIEEGQLRAINVGGGTRKFWRIPIEALAEFELTRDSVRGDLK